HLKHRLEHSIVKLQTQIFVPTAPLLSKDDDIYRIINYLSQTHRSVSRFWIEKAGLIIDAFQIYGLIWQLSQPWPWPSSWLASTRWTVVFNMDFLSFLPNGAGMGMIAPPYSFWGELPSQYWIYALTFAILPYLALLVYQMQLSWWKRRLDSQYLVKSAKLENFFLGIFQVLYLPIGLALMRLYNCMIIADPIDVHASKSVISVDPTALCHGFIHMAMAGGIGIILGVPFLIGFPVLLHRRIKSYGAYFNDEEYEVHLEAKELSYILGISDEYVLMYMQQHASYRLRMMQMPVQICLLKLSLLGIFIFLRSTYPNISNQAMQGTLYFLVLALYFIYRDCKMPFRLASTNNLMIFIDWILLFDAIMVLLSANNVRSALTVASVKVMCLNFVHTWAFIIVGCWCIVLYFSWRHMKLTWPTHFNMPAIVNHAKLVRSWVDTAKKAQELLHKDFVSPSLVKPVDELGDMVKILHSHTEEALKLQHLLHITLHDITLQVQNVFVESSSTTILQASKIDDCIHSFAFELERYREKHSILHPKKRDALFKLRVLHMLSDQHHHNHNDKQKLPSTHEIVDDDIDFVQLTLDVFLHQWINWNPATFLHSEVDNNDQTTLVNVLWYITLQHEPCQTQLIAKVDMFDVKSHWMHIKLAYCSMEPQVHVVAGWLRLNAGSLKIEFLLCKDIESWDLFQSLPHRSPPSRVSLGRIEELINNQSNSLVEWCRVLNDWESWFTYHMKHPPTNIDKKKIKLWYDKYHQYRTLNEK
ncbi:transmembrane protein, partial [Thraustotheca clavata]